MQKSPCGGFHVHSKWTEFLDSLPQPMCALVRLCKYRAFILVPPPGAQDARSRYTAHGTLPGDTTGSPRETRTSRPCLLCSHGLVPLLADFPPLLFGEAHAQSPPLLGHRHENESVILDDFQEHIVTLDTRLAHVFHDKALDRVFLSHRVSSLCVSYIPTLWRFLLRIHLKMAQAQEDLGEVGPV